MSAAEKADPVHDAPIGALPKRIGWIPFEQAMRQPDAAALIDGDLTWTYGEFAEAIRRAAALLDGLGIRPGDRAMIVAENSIALVTLVMAASELDAWPVVINARLTPPEIDAIRAHCQPRRVFYTVGVSPEARTLAQRDGAAAITADIVPGAAVGPLAATEPEPLEKVSARQVGTMVYTSGTTGKPKGVMLSHRNLAFNAATARSIRQITPADRMYIVLPITHIFGLASVFLSGLMGGARLKLVARFDPDAMLDALEHDGITMVQGVPTMYAKLLERIEARGRAPEAPAIRFLSSGGGPLEPSLKARVEKAFGITLQNGYGLSEAAPVVAVTRLGDPNPTASIGFPPEGVAVRIVDDGGRDVPTGVTGELWTKGPNVMLGYYKDAEATRATVTEDGWLKTGDLARADPDGRLAIMGRKKELIIRGGFNVHAEEVEAALNAHPAVSLSGVIGRANGTDEDIIAFVQPRPGTKLSEADLARHAAGLLTGYKRPSRYVLVEALPATSSGKVMKARLRDMARSL